MTKEAYRCLDSGEGRKLEQFGRYTLIRPSAQAIWRPMQPSLWEQADAEFSRDTGWHWREKRAQQWNIEVEGIELLLRPTEFGHLGLFPEQIPLWKWVQEKSQGLSILHLFAYSGGATLAAAKAGASVCHVDAAKGMVAWARENAALNGLQEAPIRWITEDVQKFCAREVRRGRRYDAILLDPPTFGRGAKGEVFKIERDLIPLLQLCRELLSERARYLLLSCHTAGITATALQNLLAQEFPHGTIEATELLLGKEAPIPSGWCATCLFPEKSCD